MNKEDGSKVIYSEGEAVKKVLEQSKINFSNGDLTITPDKGELFSEVNIPVPENLEAKNIAKGTNIAGIDGEYIGNGESVFVSLDFNDKEEQVITPYKDKLFSTITIEKPDTLIPGNIIAGVSIAGVLGAHECSGGDGYSIKDVAERLISGELVDNTTMNVGRCAFIDTSITEVSFPNCNNISTSAFYECKSLSYVYAPSCTAIGSGAFYNCVSLSSAMMDYSAFTVMPSEAFTSTQISEVDIPSCKSIYKSAFADCKSLKTVNAPLVTNVSPSAFADCTSLESVVLSAGAVAIGSYAFVNCTNLTNIGDAQIQKAYETAFYMCSNLQYVSFASTYVQIGRDAFNGCTNLSQVNGELWFNTSSPAIGKSAFYNCSKLSRITFGILSDIVSDSNIIGDGAFDGCFNLFSVKLLPSTCVFPINSNIFDATPIENSTWAYTAVGHYSWGTIWVPSTLYSAFRSAEGWSYYSARMRSYTV